MKTTEKTKYMTSLIEDAQNTVAMMSTLSKALEFKATISESIIKHFKATEFNYGDSLNSDNDNFNALTVAINDGLENLEGEELAQLKATVRTVLQPNLASAKVQKALFATDIEKQKTHKIAMKKVNKEMTEFDQSLLGQYVVVVESKNKGGKGESGEGEGESGEGIEVSEPTFNEAKDSEIKAFLKRMTMTPAEMIIWCQNNSHVQNC